jgi:hypothetical protein
MDGLDDLRLCGYPDSGCYPDLGVIRTRGVASPEMLAFVWSSVGITRSCREVRCVRGSCQGRAASRASGGMP